MTKITLKDGSVAYFPQAVLIVTDKGVKVVHMDHVKDSLFIFVEYKKESR
jgi:uncharacterized spore protein YtfJ